jgi:hypothetical protein
MQTANVSLVFLSGWMGLACTVNTTAAEPVEQASAAVIGVDTFLYFRSNATAWGADDSTRLLGFGAPNVFAKRYEVTQSWMLSSPDTAVVTETNQFNGWGTSQTYSGAASKLIVVPGSDTLAVKSSEGAAQFAVRYRALGVHRVLVNASISPPTIAIESSADICASVFCPAELHCELMANGRPTCVPNPGE